MFLQSWTDPVIGVILNCSGSAPAVLWGCFFRGRRTQLQSLHTRCHRAMRTSKLPHTLSMLQQYRALGTLPKKYWGSKPGPPTPGSTAPNHGYENPLGFDETFERSRGISPDPTGLEASVIDILANSKIRLCSVKRMIQIQNTS